ncbi:hypothetical protein [Marinicauda pacifica]|uniref:hypothetical protein n=1 Tax=Marinicauda pacifica TaxID=1133559 RepID=UPI0035C7B50D
MDIKIGNINSFAAERTAVTRSQENGGEFVETRRASIPFAEEGLLRPFCGLAGYQPHLFPTLIVDDVDIDGFVRVQAALGLCELYGWGFALSGQTLIAPGRRELPSVAQTERSRIEGTIRSVFAEKSKPVADDFVWAFCDPSFGAWNLARLILSGDLALETSTGFHELSRIYPLSPRFERARVEKPLPTKAGSVVVEAA